MIAGLPKRSDGTSTAAAANATSDRAATGLARLCRAPTLETEFMQTESLNAPAKTRQMFGVYPSRTRWTSRGCVLALDFSLARGTRSSGTGTCGGLRCLTFELSGRRRQDARPGLAKMYRVPPDRAWWPAVGAPLERGVRRLCAQLRTP